MSANTTHHLLADMERLRAHLGIDRWLLSAGSWGTTLALAYAQRFPERVSELVLTSVTLSRKRDVDWLYHGVSRFFPEAWQRFRDGVPSAEPSDLVAAYARRMASLETREDAANRWANWEDAVLSLEPNAVSRVYSERPAADLIAFVRICSHYAAHAAFLADDELLLNAPRIRQIPGVILHGRLDLSCPIASAWELSRAWPKAEFHALDDMGHRANGSLRTRLLHAHAQFA